MVHEPGSNGPLFRAAPGDGVIDAVYDGAGRRRNERQWAGGYEVHDARHVDLHGVYRCQTAGCRA